jgi:hypothetical protein
MIPPSVDIAVDSEFPGPHTLTVQIAARRAAGTVAVQAYSRDDLPTVESLPMGTAAHTHTWPETQRRQVEAALRLWPESLALAEGGVS